MPQLNPAPWFIIMLFSWLVFLTFIPPKVLAHAFSYEPSAQSTKKPMTKAWTWTWQ
uniref:ATP synthase F0 subunit 8 n=1 Tax=Millerichthys robustus TaxID=2588674 RepID=UPI00315CD560